MTELALLSPYTYLHSNLEGCPLTWRIPWTIFLPVLTFNFPSRVRERLKPEFLVSALMALMAPDFTSCLACSVAVAVSTTGCSDSAEVARERGLLCWPEVSRCAYFQPTPASPVTHSVWHRLGWLYCCYFASSEPAMPFSGNKSEKRGTDEGQSLARSPKALGCITPGIPFWEKIMQMVPLGWYTAAVLPLTYSLSDHIRQPYLLSLNHSIQRLCRVSYFSSWKQGTQPQTMVPGYTLQFSISLHAFLGASSIHPYMFNKNTPMLWNRDLQKKETQILLLSSSEAEKEDDQTELSRLCRLELKASKIFLMQMVINRALSRIYITQAERKRHFRQRKQGGRDAEIRRFWECMLWDQGIVL